MDLLKCLNFSFISTGGLTKFEIKAYPNQSIFVSLAFLVSGVKVAGKLSDAPSIIGVGAFFCRPTTSISDRDGIALFSLKAVTTTFLLGSAS